jgi:hypothetical protein
MTRFDGLVVAVQARRSPARRGGALGTLTRPNACGVARQGRTRGANSVMPRPAAPGAR